jgi:septum formation protein
VSPELILASTSRYRRELLARLVRDFRVVAPDIDETAAIGESPIELAERLACLKALAVADRHSSACVIGSDQVAELDGHAIGKPGSRDKAIEQLVASSGRRVVFHTAVCVASRRRDDSMMTEIAVDRTVVVFRELTEEEIVRYVDRESPLDAAGSFKSEGLGIALFECIETSDPTALIGLPLIALAHLLRGAGFELP